MQRLALCLTILPAPAALAQDFFIYGGGAVEFERAPDGKGSADQADINAYVEIEKSGFYTGVWAEVSDQSLNNKADLYFGYRAESAAGFSYDISATRRFYLKDSGDYTSVDLGLGLPLGDRLSGSADLTYYPSSHLGDAYLGLAWQVTGALALSVNYGVYGVAGAASEQEWDIGGGYALGDETVLDLRYYDGSEYVDPYFGISLSWATTLVSR